MNVQNGRPRGLGKSLARGLLAVLLLAAVMVPLLSGVVGTALDLGTPCSVTVELGSAEFAADMRRANLVVDLYQLASLKQAGTDSYTYELLPPFDGLSITRNMSATAVEALAQEAMKIAIKQGTPIVTAGPTEQRIGKTDAGDALQGGLYLVLAHGADVDEYVRRMVNDKGETRLVTVAYTNEYEYTLAPELVYMPVRSEDQWFYDMAVYLQPGQVLYDASITLKPQREPRSGSLEILKTLRTYKAPEEATFVFSIEASYEGRSIYSDVQTLSFTDAGQKSIVIHDIPLGAEITVSEVYSGASYTLRSPAARQLVMENMWATVEFINDYDETDKKGHGIVNHFEYDADTGWGWTRMGN